LKLAQLLPIFAGHWPTAWQYPAFPVEGFRSDAFFLGLGHIASDNQRLHSLLLAGFILLMAIILKEINPGRNRESVI